jgi:branched-chain amino acid transport system ATP-binding protein
MDNDCLPSLVVKNLHAYYGKSHILHGVDLQVNRGEIVSLLGRNGAGRSTTVKAIMGFARATGSVRKAGSEILGRRAFEIANLGVGYVPESRDIFPTLTVEENLILGKKRGRPARWTFDDMYALFPRLHERRKALAGVLSGGEQQMLTLCRALMGDPDVILIDEPTEGLAPMIVEQVGRYLQELERRGLSVLLVEQKMAIAVEISKRVYVMGRGQIVFDGSPEDLRRNSDVRREWLEV